MSWDPHANKPPVTQLQKYHKWKQSTTYVLSKSNPAANGTLFAGSGVIGAQSGAKNKPARTIETKVVRKTPFPSPTKVEKPKPVSYHTPGYTGHVQAARFQHGQSYSKITRQSLSKPVNGAYS